MIMLDRITPFGGLKTCGTVLDLRFCSFVGDYELPSQYALTCGELALYLKNDLHLSLDLTAVPLEGWEHRMYLDDTRTVDSAFAQPSDAGSRDHLYRCLHFRGNQHQ